MQLKEHRTRPQSLADLLLYDALIDDGVLLQQDGSLMAAWSFRGPDLASATHSEMAIVSARLNSILRFGAGWMIQCDAIRTRAPQYPEYGAFPDPITRLVDEERRQQFLREGAHFESEYVLTLTHLPPSATEQNLRGWLFDGQSNRPSAADQALSAFRARVGQFEEVLGSLFQATRLRSEATEGKFGEYVRQDNLLRFLRRTITGDDYPFTLPLIPSYLNDLLSADDFAAGIEPRIGQKHIRVVAIDGFPNTSSHGILSTLDSLPIEYR